MDALSGAVSEGLSRTLESQSPTLAAAKSYQERFLSKNRLEKSHKVYIDAEISELLVKMVGVVGTENVSLGAYVSEIVREHVERNRDSINAIYLTNTRPLF